MDQAEVESGSAVASALQVLVKQRPRSQRAASDKAQTGPRRIEIFISHKARDGDREAACQIKDLLNKIDGVTAFVSSSYASVAGGEPFLEKIHAALDSADAFFLLYTDPDEVWDWCLYECGYFKGKHRGKRKFTSIHPLDLTAPAPIRLMVQTVAARSGDVQAALERIFFSVRRTSQVTCADGHTLAGICDKIADTVQELSCARWKCDTGFDLCTPPGSIDELSAGKKMSNKARITLRGKAGEIIGRSGGHIFWPAFSRLAEEVHFETDALVDLCRAIARDEPISRPMLPLLLSKEDRNRAYRPCIVS